MQQQQQQQQQRHILEPIPSDKQKNLQTYGTFTTTSRNPTITTGTTSKHSKCTGNRK